MSSMPTDKKKQGKIIQKVKGVGDHHVKGVGDHHVKGVGDHHVKGVGVQKRKKRKQ